MEISAKDYWAERFSQVEAIAHHSEQNRMIARDFSAGMEREGMVEMAKSILQPRVIEVGCGTGDMTDMLGFSMGIDFSHHAIDTAIQRFPHLRMKFMRCDIMTDEVYLLENLYSLAVASNCAEHFKNPFAFIDRMFMLAPRVLLLVPWEQILTDRYDEEGGAGHVFSFGPGSLDRYRLIEHFLFKSDGWSNLTSEFQWAVLLEKK